MRTRRVLSAFLVIGAIGALLSPAMTSGAGALAGATAPNLASRYGVNGTGEWTPSGPNPGRATTVAQYSRDAGFKWMRTFVHWNVMQPSATGCPTSCQPVWNQDALDQLNRDINRYRALGFSIEVTFNEIPDWAKVATQTGLPQMCTQYFPNRRKPASPAYFHDFMYGMAQMFKGKVAAWEMWNEPDPNGHCEFPGTPAEFRQLALEPGYDGVRQADPSVMVLGPALASTPPVSQLDAYYTYTKNGRHYLDRPLTALSVHQYGSVSTIEQTMNTANNYHRCTEDGASCLGKYWLTEFGFDANDSGSQTRSIFQHCDAQANCGRAFYFTDGFDTNGHTYGLVKVNNDGSVTKRAKYDVVKAYITSKEAPLPPPPSCAGGTEKAVAGASIAYLGRPGAYLLAFQGGNNHLWMWGPSGVTDTGLGMMPGTVPSVAAMPDGTYEIAFQANTGVLWTTGTRGTRNLGAGMAAGTSPSITADVRGGFQIAFQANTGALWSMGDRGTSNFNLGMAAQTSPSITAVGPDGYEIAFQANTGVLWKTGTRGTYNLGFGMAANTSPSIATLSEDTTRIAFIANTNVLWTTGDTGWVNTGLGTDGITGPGITGTPGGGYRVAMRSNVGDLWFTGPTGSVNTHNHPAAGAALTIAC